MTTALMYDGINSLAAGIARSFPNATRVAGYLNGRFAWTQADWNLFPHADHITITISASLNGGDVLDVENGDATPDQAAGWIAMRKAATYFRPTIYCSRSTIPAVRAGTGKYILGTDYDIWVADYTGSAHQVEAPGSPAAACAVTQYNTTAGYDVSAVYDTAWPQRTPPAPPQPAIGMSVTPHTATTRVINVYRSAGTDFKGEFTTTAKPLLGKIAATETSTNAHASLSVASAGVYTITTTANGCKTSSKKVIVT